VTDQHPAPGLVPGRGGGFPTLDQHNRKEADVDEQELLEIVKRLGGADDSGEEDEVDDFAALRDEHAATEDDAWDESPLSDTLAGWLDSDDAVVRRGASIALAEVSPGVLLQQVRRRLPSRLPGENQDRARMADYADGVGHAVGQLQEHYFGSYCPGCLDALAENPEDHQREYERLERVARPVADFYEGQPFGNDLTRLLSDVRPETVR
jgi:hypothetical protein